MNEAQVSMDGKTQPLPQPFFVVATQNPVEHHGTYPLPESQLDRFLMRIKMGYPSHETEREILRNRIGDDPLESLDPVADLSEVLAMQEAVSHIKVDSSLHDYALEIVSRTRKTEQLALGVSPRGTLMLQRAAQARAFLDGRDYCLPDDFKQLAVPAFGRFFSPWPRFPGRFFWRSIRAPPRNLASSFLPALRPWWRWPSPAGWRLRWCPRWRAAPRCAGSATKSNTRFHAKAGSISEYFRSWRWPP